MNILIIILNIIVLMQYNTSDDNPDLKTGDLIFQESCSGKTGDAIKNVTTSVEGYNFTHVGIVWIDHERDTFVIEATPPEVTITPLNDYLYPVDEKNCPPKSVAARLKKWYRHLIPDAIIEAKKLVGKEYDYAFILGNDKYYCSELIYDILLKANKGQPVFKLNVMTFKKKESEKYDPNWVDYYSKLGLPIPEGESGINPGIMSTSSNIIEILYEFK